MQDNNRISNWTCDIDHIYWYNSWNGSVVPAIKTKYRDAIKLTKGKLTNNTGNGRANR